MGDMTVGVGSATTKWFRTFSKFYELKEKDHSTENNLDDFNFFYWNDSELKQCLGVKKAESAPSNCRADLRYYVFKISLSNMS